MLKNNIYCFLDHQFFSDWLQGHSKNIVRNCSNFIFISCLYPQSELANQKNTLQLCVVNVIQTHDNNADLTQDYRFCFMQQNLKTISFEPNK